MKNNFFSIRNHQSNYNKSKTKEHKRKKIDAKWNLITGKNPIIKYPKKSKTVLKKNDSMSEKISNIHNNIRILARVSEATLRETKKQTVVLENIATVFKRTFNDKITPKIKLEGIVSPPREVTQERRKRLGENNSKELYEKVKILKKKYTWNKIAILLNSKNVPTLSGTSAWGPELLRYFMKKMAICQKK